LSSHKNTEALNLIRETGAQILFLPLYRPELNAIEYYWPVIKNNVKKLQPKSKKEVTSTFTSSLNLITPKKIRDFFEHCWA
jgi:transposase